MSHSRTFRACDNCRERKVKCNLGDVDAPKEPPCSRCQRERSECKFTTLGRRRGRHRLGSVPKSRQSVEPSKASPSGLATKILPKNQWNPMDFNIDETGWQATQDTSASNLAISMVPGDTSDPPSFVLDTPSSIGHAAPPVADPGLTGEMDALDLIRGITTVPQFGRLRAGTTSTSLDSLSDFPLVTMGILSERDVLEIVEGYFQHLHPLHPIIHTSKIPKSYENIVSLAQEEPLLVVILIIVRSRHSSSARMREIHQRSMLVFSEALRDYVFLGIPATLGLVEGLLILAEYLPRAERKLSEIGRRLLLYDSIAGPTLHGAETRRFWSMTVTAVRAAYGLGLDQIENSMESTPELERARLAWRWCQQYDRTVGLRTGRACWGRGPNVSINMNPQASAMQSAAETSTEGEVNAFLQALTELTLIATNAHDILYPSKAQTRLLFEQGMYSRYIDQFLQSLADFKLNWGARRWKTPHREYLVDCTVQFVLLLITSFGFQAHLNRTNAPAGELRVIRTAALLPEARFIHQALEAATRTMQLCIKFKDLGILANLPSRYFVNIAYAGTFALKTAHSGLMIPDEVTQSRNLVIATKDALLAAAPDTEHSASRYGSLLQQFLGRLTKSEQNSRDELVSRDEPGVPPSLDVRTEPDMLDHFLDQSNTVFLNRFLNESHNGLLDLGLNVELDPNIWGQF